MPRFPFGFGGGDKPADAAEGLAAFFAGDHARCDQLWTDAENAAESGDPARARAAIEAFAHALEQHLQMEEEVLFPAFEHATGMTSGPTVVMRMEHTQMRGVLRAIDNAVQAGDIDGALDQGDTLLMLIQQHNAKEEGMLYPMAEQALASAWAELEPRVKRYVSS